MITRHCRSCKAVLPASRYFNCLTCKPELDDVQDEFIYESPRFDEQLEESFEDI